MSIIEIQNVEELKGMIKPEFLKLITESICLDFETTGLSTTADEPVQMAIVEVDEIGGMKSNQMLFKPSKPISEDAAAVHGIHMHQLEGKKPFRNIAAKLYQRIKNKTLIGYNSNSFDYAMLFSQLDQKGIQWNYIDNQFIDVLKLYQDLYPNTLTEVFKRLTGKSIDNTAHDAEIDTLATLIVLQELLEKNRHLLLTDDGEISTSIIHRSGGHFVDFGGWFELEVEGLHTDCLVFRRGKHKGKALIDVYSNQKHYISWMLFKGEDIHTSSKIAVCAELNLSYTESMKVKKFVKKS